MSRRYQQDSRSPSAVFVPMLVDREMLGEKKVEALQRQIERLENDQVKRKELIEKLSSMQRTQDKNKREHQQRLLVCPYRWKGKFCQKLLATHADITLQFATSLLCIHIHLDNLMVYCPLLMYLTGLFLNTNIC